MLPLFVLLKAGPESFVKKKKYFVFVLKVGVIGVELVKDPAGKERMDMVWISDAEGSV